MKQIYGLDCQIIEDPVSGTPLIVPESRHHRQENTSAKKDTVEEKTEKEQIEASIKTESICAWKIGAKLPRGGLAPFFEHCAKGGGTLIAG